MNIREQISEINPNALVLDPEFFDKAIVGFAERCGMCVVAYSRDRLIDLLVEHEEMELEEALEHFEFNILGAYVGEHTPVFITELEDDPSTEERISSD